MKVDLIDELRSLLQGSDTRLRKHWAQRIIDEQVPVSSLMTLLHGHEKTAQRFTWLIGDLLDADRASVEDCVPMLFELRDKMPFPGMQRTVAKCLWFLKVPEELGDKAIDQLFEWLEGADIEIGVKHYSAKALYDLALSKRIDARRLAKILHQETQHENAAYAGRTEKLRMKLTKALSL